MPRPRPGRRPAPTLEALEGRQLLSKFSSWLDRAVDRLSDRTKEAIVEAKKAVGTAAAPTVAIVGDGLSDEYAGRFPARNWAELLAASGQINLGAHSDTPLPDTRSTGHALNWATEGATTDQILARQLPGLLDQVKTGNVDLVVVMAGSADFKEFLDTEAQALAARPALLAARLDDLRQRVDSNLAEVVREVKMADPEVEVVIATLPDRSNLPGWRPIWAAAGPDSQADRVVAQTERAIDKVNTEIRSRARGQGRLAVADLDRHLSARLRGTGRLRLGPETIDLAALGTDYRQFLLPDGSHPGTVGQALIANVVSSAANTQLKGRFHPLGSTEILAMASLVDPA
jgi:hypothetical protein